MNQSLPQPIPDEFMLDPEFIHLNHGSFGACPRTVFEKYQEYQRELENNPMYFYNSIMRDRLQNVREKLAAYINAGAEDLIFLPNVTTAFFIFMPYLQLHPGDEILTVEHEYMAYAIRSLGYLDKADIVERKFPLPISDPEAFVESFWAGVTERTKVIFISHIAAFVAMIYPIEEICRRARERNIITFVDGAHCPGQIPLDMQKIGADIYTGNCHKWMCTPKGSAFVYVHPERQHWISTARAVGRGWMDPITGEIDDETSGRLSNSLFSHCFSHYGTHDPSAHLCIGDSIDFMEKHDWDAQRQRCHLLASETRERINDLTGLESICPDSTDWFSQMVSVRIPEAYMKTLHKRFAERKMMTVLGKMNGTTLMRISFQAYNTQADADAVIDVIKTTLANPPEED